MRAFVRCRMRKRMRWVGPGLPQCRRRRRRSGGGGGSWVLGFEFELDVSAE